MSAEADGVAQGYDEEPVLTLRSGPCTATIHPAAGGRLGQLDLGDGPLLRGPGGGAGWAYWGAFPLLPWSNRIPDGHLVLGSIDCDLPVNWEDGSAIHGLVAAVPWSVVGASPCALRLAVDAAAGSYRISGAQSFDLRPHELELRLAVVNRGDHPVPVGIGIHPWLRAGPVRVPAERIWPAGSRPDGRPMPVDPEHDLRDERVPPEMDRCLTGLTDALVEVPGLELGWEGPVTQVVVYNGVPGWLAVEPVTMANDGFRLADQGIPGHGVQVLAPGRELAVRYHFRRPGRSAR
jgi:aldose 1-epimerase